MRKIILTLILIVVTSISATAGCVTNDDSIMYFEPDRFFRVARVCAANQAQGAAMMGVDVENGDAVIIARGTRIEEMKAVPNAPGTCVVKIRNLLLVGLTEYIKCN